MDFWSIFFPVSAALVFSFSISEAFHYALNWWLYKKQEEARKEFEAKVASGEIDPMALMMAGGGMPGFGPMPPGGMIPPTVSGNPPPGAEHEPGTGQYL